MSMEEQAFDLIAHLSQEKNFGMDYISHVSHRVEYLREYDFQYDDDILAAGYLLDVLNHGISFEELEKRFSTDVAQLVYNHGRNYRRTALVLADLMALAERLNGSPLLGLLRGYYEATRSNLKDGDELGGMWSRLDCLMGVKS